MRMRLKSVKGGRKWYSNFFHKGEKIEVSLEAWEPETRRAQQNLGKILRDLEEGVNPVAVRKRVNHLKYPYTDERGQGAWEKHILPYFGRYKISEVDQQAVEDYIESRWGRTPEGRLQAVRSTLKKELRALKCAVQTTIKKWECPMVETVEPPKTKPIKHRLYPDQVVTVAGYVKEQSKKNGQEYLWAYWIAAYTGAEPVDTVGDKGLAPAMIDWRRNVILKDRGKTSEKIQAPLHTALKKIIQEIPIPISPDIPYLAEIKPRNFSKAVERAFDAAGLREYTVKDLRRFVATILSDRNVPDPIIQKVIGHSEGSKQTRKYIGVYDERVLEKFENAFAAMGTQWEGQSQNGSK